MIQRTLGFFGAAKLGDNGGHWYLLGIFLIIIGYFVGQIPVTVALGLSINNNLAEGEDFQEALASFSEDMNFERFGIDSNLGFLLLLMTFICGLIALYIVVTKIHKKKFINLIKPDSKLDWSKMLFCFMVWIGLTLIFEFALHQFGLNKYTFQFDLMKFLPLLLISILILPLQTSFEELLFRGYFMQGISLLAYNKWVPLIITSILFGLIHSANPEVTKYGFWNMQFYYVAVGLFLGILTILDDSLEIALAVHAATNFYGACLIGYEGSAIQTASIFKSSDLDTTIMTLGFIVIAIIFYIIVSKRYKFASFDYIFQKLNFDNEIT